MNEFEIDIGRIMGSVRRLEQVEVDDPASYGWLRRPEFDVIGLDAWERPDGHLVGLRRDGRTSRRVRSPRR